MYLWIREVMGVTSTMVAIAAFYFLVIIVRFVVNRRRDLQLLKKYGIAGPEPSFLSGNMRELRGKPNYNDVISGWIKRYGNVFGYYIGGVPSIVVNDLELLKQVMLKDFAVFCNRPSMTLDISPLNKTLLALRDKRWKEVRTVITPTFSSGKIKLMTDIIDKKVDVTMRVVAGKAEKGEMFDMYHLVQGLTLDVIADCALAMKTHCQENPKDNFLVSVREFFRFAHNKAVELAIMFPFAGQMMSLLANHLHSGHMSIMIVDNVKRAIAARRQHREGKSVDILQLMLDNSEQDPEGGITDEELVANAFVMLLAGYETTATSLAFVFYLLVTNPDVQERLHEDVRDVEDLNYQAIQNIAYLDQVFSESLRIFPPVTGFVSRRCERDHQVGDYTFPQGATILAPVWDIHHDPDYWPDPFKFDPDRFSPDNKASINSMAFMPFGVGRRNCIGARFATLEAKLAIFRLVKYFRFEVCEKTDHPVTLICPTVIINPANGVYLRAVKRNLEE